MINLHPINIKILKLKMFAGIVLQSVHHQNIVSDQEKTPTNSPMKTKQASKCSFKYYLGKSVN